MVEFYVINKVILSDFLVQLFQIMTLVHTCSLQGAATSFTTREYIRDREKVEQALFAAVRDRLGGKCCEKYCGKNFFS